MRSRNKRKSKVDSKWLMCQDPKEVIKAYYLVKRKLKVTRITQLDTGHYVAHFDSAKGPYGMPPILLSRETVSLLTDKLK